MTPRNLFPGIEETWPSLLSLSLAQPDDDDSPIARVHGNMVCSRCLGHQHPELQVGNSTRFLAEFLGGTPPFGRPPRNSQSRPSSVMTLSTKLIRPWRDLFSLHLYHVGHFNVELKCSYTLDYIVILFTYDTMSHMYALLGLAVCAKRCNVILHCIVSSFFVCYQNLAQWPNGSIIIRASWGVVHANFPTMWKKKVPAIWMRHCSRLGPGRANHNRLSHMSGFSLHWGIS